MGGTQSAHEAMARGPKKHLKRLNAPKHWMLDKMGGVWAPRPSTGPHKLRECLPIILILRNRLKYALTKKEVQQILMQRLIKVDGKVRTDPNYPCGFMDVISIDKTDEHFRMLYDAKGRFVVHRLNHKNFSKEKDYKLCRCQKLAWGAKSVPYIATHDGRTIRYPDPNTKVHDTVKVDIATGKATDMIKVVWVSSLVVRSTSVLSRLCTLRTPSSAALLPASPMCSALLPRTTQRWSLSHVARVSVTTSLRSVRSALDIRVSHCHDRC